MSARQRPRPSVKSVKGKSVKGKSVEGSFALLALLTAAACGGAVDNSDLFKKNGTTSSSGGTPTATPTATSTPPSGPTANPPPPPPAPTTCDVSFAADVTLVLQQAGCGGLACHNGGINRPTVDPTSPSLTYKSLTTFTMSTGDPYVAVGDPDPKASGMFCNLRGDCGVRMPLGGRLTSKQLAVIDSWLACGAPFN